MVSTGGCRFSVVYAIRGVASPIALAVPVRLDVLGDVDTDGEGPHAHRPDGRRRPLNAAVRRPASRAAQGIRLAECDADRNRAEGDALNEK